MKIIDADRVCLKFADMAGKCSNEDIKTGIRMCLEVLRNEVPVPGKERHGQWTEEHLVSTGGGSYNIYRCSECGYADPSCVPGNYCRSCGARMDVGLKAVNDPKKSY